MLEGALKSISGRWIGKLLRRAAIRPVRGTPGHHQIQLGLRKLIHR